MENTVEAECLEKPDRDWYVKRFQDEKLNQLFTLRSGKRISYAEVGPEDGHPVFVFPGLGGSRQFLLLLEDAANKSGLHLISPDRSGIGLSDPVEDNQQKQPLAWPDTVAELADHLRLEKFALMGQSMGCIYALACALKMPERVIGKVFLLCPWIPLSVPGTKGIFKVAQYTPNFLLSATSSMMTSFPSMLSSMGSINLMTKGWSEAERKNFNKTFFEVYIEVSRKENMSGFKDSVMVALEKYGSWGFRYEDVTLPCHIFHGGKDDMVPIAAAEFIAGAMPNCKLNVYPDGTHNALMDNDIMLSVFRKLADSIVHVNQQ